MKHLGEASGIKDSIAHKVAIIKDSLAPQTKLWQKYKTFHGMGDITHPIPIQNRLLTKIYKLLIEFSNK